jgi:hypothetical protein
MLPQVQPCAVCGNCIACGPDVLTDPYIDSIDALLQTKIQALGSPLAITRSPTNQSITYQIQYPNGLDITLALTLSNMQIQLISYAVDSSYNYSTGNVATQSVQQTGSQTAQAQPQITADGYYIINNFTDNAQVTAIAQFVT